MAPYIGPPKKLGVPVTRSIVRVLRFYAWLFCIVVTLGMTLYIGALFLPENSASIAALGLPLFVLILLAGLIGIKGLINSSKNSKSSKALQSINGLVKVMFLIIGIFVLYVAFNYLVALKQS